MERYLSVLGLIFCIFVAVPSSGYLKQEECPKKQEGKIAVIIFSEELEVKARLFRETSGGIIYSDWMSVEEVIESRKKMIEFGYGDEDSIKIEYDKCLN